MKKVVKRKINKPVSKNKNVFSKLEKNNFFKWGIIAFSLIIAITLILSAVLNSTGNVITGRATLQECEAREQILCPDNTCADYPTQCPSTTQTNTGDKTVQTVEKINDWIEHPLSNLGKSIKGFLDGVGNQKTTLPDDWKNLVVMLLIFIMVFVSIYDILTLLSIFDKDWVIWTITICLSLIIALTGLINSTAFAAFKLAAKLGIWATVVEIGVCFILFIGLSFGSTKIAMWAVKRKTFRETIKSANGTREAINAVRSLRDIDKELRADRKKK